MSTIENAETREMEINLALAWHEGHYTDAEAKLSAEERSLNFINVTYERSRLYEADVKSCASDYMLSNILNIEARYHHGNN